MQDLDHGLLVRADCVRRLRKQTVRFISDSEVQWYEVELEQVVYVDL